MRINPPTKIFVSTSSIHGLGVFSKDFIDEGEQFEECPILTLPIKKGDLSGLMLDYRFNYPTGLDWEEQVIGLGFASLYNHSEDPNAFWVSDNEKRTFKFVAKRNIFPMEEITVYYGGSNYWNDGRSHIEVKI